MASLAPRRNVRYKPEPLEFGLVMFDGNKAGWHPDAPALIIDESAVSGCQLVLRFGNHCQPGDRIRVKLGAIDPLLGEVVWRREVDADLYRIGIRFLE